VAARIGVLVLDVVFVLVTAAIFVLLGGFGKALDRL